MYVQGVTIWKLLAMQVVACTCTTYTPKSVSKLPPLGYKKSNVQCSFHTQT